MYEDMTKRPLNALSDVPVHIYVAGWPCQPFSVGGLHLGEADPRGELYNYVLEVIMEKKPHSFILENVRGLTTRTHNDTFNIILLVLRSIKDSNNNPLYDVHWELYDTAVHGGLPQHRERCYIVGVKRSMMLHRFEMPGPQTCQKISEVITHRMKSADYGDTAEADLPNTKKANLATAFDVALRKMLKSPRICADGEPWIYDLGGTRPTALQGARAASHNN